MIRRYIRRGVLAAGLALLVAGYLGRDFLARKAIERATERETGFPLRIESLHLDLLGGRVDARGIELMNPAEFPERRFVSLPLVHLEYDTGSLLRREPHLRQLTVQVDEVFIVTDAKGEKNTARLAASPGPGPARPGERPPRYRVDALHVRIEKVVVKDFSHGRKSERTIALHLDKTYRNVTSSTDLSALVLGSVFEALVPVVGDVAKGVGGAIEGVGGGLERMGKGLLDRLRGKP